MKRLPKEDRAGLYITVIVHLAVLIILLLAQIGRTIQKESSFVLDFTKMEEFEKLQKEISFKEEISRRLEEMIAENGGMPIRNVTVDRSQLKDDRDTDAEKLYEDAEKLQKELDNGFNSDDYADVAPEKPEKKQESKKEVYHGASVLEWELTGRKASKLPIPAYRCLGAGEVKVLITVNNQGQVVDARIDDSASSKDGCLREFGKRAARKSLFSMDAKGDNKARGYIIYKFIAQ